MHVPLNIERLFLDFWKAIENVSNALQTYRVISTGCMV